MFRGAIFRALNLEAMFASIGVPEKCRAICSDLEEILTLLILISGKVGLCVASVGREQVTKRVRLL